MRPKQIQLWGAALTLCASLLLVQATESGWAGGSVTNSSNTTVSGALAFSHTYQGATCAGAVRVAGTIPCAGSPVATDSITNNGTLGSSQLSSAFAIASCAPVQLANVATTADPLLPRYDVSFQQSDPWGGANALSLNGANAYAADVQVTPSSLFTTYTVGLWFRVAAGYANGGGLISLDTSPYNVSSAAGSPMLWMDTSGRIRYRVNGALGGSSFGVTSGSYNDGNWHFAMLSFGSLNGTLYVDNTSVTGTALTQLANSGGYWHVGWVDSTGTTNPPATPNLTGSLLGAFVRSATTTSAQETTLRTATSATDYSAKLSALGSLTNYWPLNDSGTTTYTGALPIIGATSACSMTDIAWAVANPAGTVTAATKLSTFADGAWHAVPSPGPGQSQASTITISHDPTYNSYVAGLRLYAPILHRVQASPAPSSWSMIFNWSDNTSSLVE